MPSIKNLIIDSSQRINGTPDDFTIVYPLPITDPVSISLESIQMYNTQYTVNSNNYQVPFRTNNNSNVVASLPHGNYDSDSLAAAITLSMTTAASNLGDNSAYTCYYDQTIAKYSLSNNTGNFNFNFNLALPTIAKNIGFSEQLYSSNAAYVGESIGYLNPKYFTIYSDLMYNNSVDGLGAKSLIAYVPNNVNFGDIIDYKPHLAKTFTITKKDLSRIKVQVKDDRGLQAQLNGVNWSMNLVVSTKD